MTSRTELMTVMIPTYRSPPNFWSMTLYMICTELLVMDMVKPDMPSPTMRRMRAPSSFMADGRSRRIVLFPVRNAMIHAADRNCDRMVARAAPLTPMWNTKINMGSSMMLLTAPSSTVIMPTVPNPWELMKLFMPRPVITKILPIR